MKITRYIYNSSISSFNFMISSENDRISFFEISLSLLCTVDDIIIMKGTCWRFHYVFVSKYKNIKSFLKNLLAISTSTKSWWNCRFHILAFCRTDNFVTNWRNGTQNQIKIFDRLTPPSADKFVSRRHFLMAIFTHARPSSRLKSLWYWNHVTFH